MGFRGNRARVHVRTRLSIMRDRLQRRRALAQLKVRAGEDPTTSITSPHDAIVIAEALLESVPRQQVCDGFWQTVAVRPLTALLYAASPQGNRGGIAWVDLALDNLDANV